MYKFLKSKFNWNPVTIRIIWSLMIAFCVVFWYYSFKLFDFVVHHIAKFV